MAVFYYQTITDVYAINIVRSLNFFVLIKKKITIWICCRIKNCTYEFITATEAIVKIRTRA